MFMQSAAMALGFGSFFQYGKRKISAMPNEEFNLLTPEALSSELITNINNMIPTVADSFHQMERMNVMILEAMAKYFEQATTFLSNWIAGGAQNLLHNVQTVTGLHENPEDPHGTEFLHDLGIGAGGHEQGATPPGTVDQQFTQPDLNLSTGPIGPQIPKWSDIDPFYRNMTYKQLKSVFDSKATWNRLSKIEKLLIVKRMKEIKPKPKTQAEIQAAIDKAAPKDSVVNNIATLWRKMNATLKVYQGSKIRKNMNLFLNAMKTYNRYVQSVGKAHMTINTGMSLRFFSLVVKKSR